MHIIIAKQIKLLHRAKRKVFHYTGLSYWIATFYKFFIISRIEDAVRYKFFCLKILISVSCICFLNKFLLADFLIFSGKAFHNCTPNRENEFFSCSKREDT